MNRQEATLFIKILKQKINDNLDKRVKDPNFNVVKVIESPSGIKIKIINAVWKSHFLSKVTNKMKQDNKQFTEKNYDDYTLERIIRLTKMEFRKQYANKYEIN